MNNFARLGWKKFAFDPALSDWIKSVYPAALEAVAAPENNDWLQCEGTWFVGVDVLGNDALGALPDGPVLSGAAFEFACQPFGNLPLHKGQISVIYPGYPKARKGESDAALNYRIKRDAAHLDGLKPRENKRRFMDEYHAYVLGISLTGSAQSPLVVWEGSHEVIREMLRDAFANLPQERWHEVDLTEAYTAARKQIFERCQRVEVPLERGEAYVVHRFALHGVAPWTEGVEGPDEGRMIAYFRPDVTDRLAWLNEA
ncbi:hypothetical protein [Lentibacter algarum]|uniref:hypothetical protein n=1 Tax=Lentibacter algarum TaxID=576131 RepID=UPI0020915C6D|nr:hypothetical protein [Lentibacter algarum]